MDCILEQHSLATLQFLVLLGVHGQRSPYGAGAWSQIRYATSVCIEMGLHRKQTRITSAEQARDVEIRRRIFWSCYCLDRTTSIVLGRAFAIAERDINVEVSKINSTITCFANQVRSFQVPEDSSGRSHTKSLVIQLKANGRTSSLSYTSSSLTRSTHASTRRFSVSTRTYSMARPSNATSLTGRWPR